MSAPAKLLNEALNALRADPARAEVLCRAVLEAEPDNGDAKLVLSEALRRKGDLRQARVLATEEVKARPGWFGAHRQLGIILADAGEPLPASLALATAAALNPSHPTIWRELADQRALAGDTPGAQAAYANHARSGGEPRLNAVAKLLADNEVAAAEQQLMAFLAEFPTDVVALRMLSEAQARDNRPDEAEATLRRCLELAPGFGFARHSLAQLLMGLGRNEEAYAEAQTLSLQDPANRGSQRLRAAVLNGLGEYERAAEIYAKLLTEDPMQPRTWMSYGHVLKTMGRTEEGIKAYRTSIKQAPQLGESYWSLANLKTVRFTDAEIAAARAALQRPDLSVNDRVNLLYALGKAHEDKGEAAEAFAHYSEGAALQRANERYEPARLTRFVDQSIDLFTPDFFAQRRGVGSERPDAIFIVGLPRAGSTLLEQILASHSQVEGTAELPDLQTITNALVTSKEAIAGRTYLDVLPTLAPPRFRAFGERYLETTQVQRKLGRPYFINKLPNNFAHVGFIRLALPNAKIIDARRHPMACCFSCFKQHFALGQLFTYGLDDLGRYYRDYVRLMAHYDAVLPGAVHRVIHEELVADPEPHIRALLDFCGLPFEAACLSPQDTERAVKTASSEQVRRPISAKGLDSWKPYEPYLGELKAALGDVLDIYPDAP